MFLILSSANVICFPLFLWTGKSAFSPIAVKKINENSVKKKGKKISELFEYF